MAGPVQNVCPCTDAAGGHDLHRQSAEHSLEKTSGLPHPRMGH